MLITVWAFTDFSFFSNKSNIDGYYLVLWLIGAACAWWLSSRVAAHLLMFGLTLWIWFNVAYTLDIPNNTLYTSVLFLSIFGAFLAVGIALYSLGRAQWFKGFEQASLVHLAILLGGLVTIWYLALQMPVDNKWHLVPYQYVPGIIASLLLAGLAAHAYRTDHPLRYDILVAAVFTLVTLAVSAGLARIPFLIQAFMLALTIWAIRMGWRLEYRALSTFGFNAFAAVLLLFYVDTLSSLLDSSLFYFGAGILLVAGAIIIPRFAKANRPNTESPAKGAQS
jgi:uncharacterized membrane protein